jgi:hypothetical protein
VRIRATLRNGNQYVLALGEPGADPREVFAAVVAGRSHPLRGWVRVEPTGGASEIVVSGDEIVELHLLAH